MGAAVLGGGAVSEFDDERLQGAMRAYLRSVDALAGAAGDGDDKAMLEAADAKRLAEMVLRRQLEGLGWTAPARARTRSAASDEPVHRTPGAGGG